MENQAVEAMALAGSTNLDFSVVSLFMKADLVVKTVILMLFAASIWSWAIIFEKMISLRRLNKRSDKFEDRFWSGDSLDSLYDKIGSRPSDPMSAVFAAAMREWRRATP
ncbi:MAG TPA: Tol-Pal system subunit TolQ, partial [Rhodospirillaceae bacterium]|nr:Tol-Pal system subunit TolQ [Rhodospirillaceae bacterium]